MRTVDSPYGIAQSASQVYQECAAESTTFPLPGFRYPFLPSAYVFVGSSNLYRQLL